MIKNIFKNIDKYNFTISFLSISLVTIFFNPPTSPGGDDYHMLIVYASKSYGIESFSAYLGKGYFFLGQFINNFLFKIFGLEFFFILEKIIYNLLIAISLAKFGQKYKISLSVLIFSIIIFMIIDQAYFPGHFLIGSGVGTNGYVYPLIFLALTYYDEFPKFVLGIIIVATYFKFYIMVPWILIFAYLWIIKLTMTKKKVFYYLIVYSIAVAPLFYDVFFDQFKTILFNQSLDLNNQFNTEDFRNNITQKKQLNPINLAIFENNFLWQKKLLVYFISILIISILSYFKFFKKIFFIKDFKILLFAINLFLILYLSLGILRNSFIDQIWLVRINNIVLLINLFFLFEYLKNFYIFFQERLSFKIITSLILILICVWQINTLKHYSFIAYNKLKIITNDDYKKIDDNLSKSEKELINWIIENADKNDSIILVDDNFKNYILDSAGIELLSRIPTYHSKKYKQQRYSAFLEYQKRELNKDKMIQNCKNFTIRKKVYIVVHVPNEIKNCKIEKIIGDIIIYKTKNIS